MTTDNPARPDDDPDVLDADEVLDPASVPLTDREPVINRLKPAQRRLLYKKHAMGTFVPPGYDPDDPSSPTVWKGPNGLDETDIASMLEVAWLLGLDPFTPGEIWCARSKPKDEGKDAGKLLIMVGRDGRRKIVQRNGLRMRGDVVREKDTFEVEHTEPRVTIVHRYSGGAEQREKIIGAWSEVWDPRTGETRGFYFAPIGEYDTGQSVWAHQKSAMILAATERQSVAMGTPLSGLIGEGEAEINQQPVLGATAAPAELESGVELVSAAREVVDRARELGHAGLSQEFVAAVATQGRSAENVARWAREQHETLDRWEASHAPEAPKTRPLIVCNATDPAHPERHCQRASGHDGFHWANDDGETWDSFLPADEREAPDVTALSEEEAVAEAREALDGEPTAAIEPRAGKARVTRRG